ncbi:MAG: chitobiase/beta-hexosaminidase C-terminal domain-containing protein, partial [Muribaculaceae bacterium]|nr:chitobiase/beta-hexosaminidase C-terminal domain-containing protein [Muribaculaceae bacterium]
MKKFLLSLTALVLTILGANAETALFYATANPGPSADASYQLTGTVADQSYAAGGITISFTKVNSSKSNVTSNQVRFYQSDILTIKPTTAGSAVIKSIEISCASDAYASNLKLTSPDTGASTNNTTFTFTSNGGADEVVITANKQSRFTYLLVTYELTAPKQVEDVEISYELQNNNDALVTLTCPTEGATIYYGFSADAVTNEYTAPFTVSETCSVYAYSKKDDAESTLKNISINIYKSFKDIIAEAEKDEEITINGNFQLLYQNGNYIVITDGTSNLLLFDGSVADLAEGTKFSQIKGTVGDYNNLMEIMDVTLTEGGEGAAYTPAEYESLAGINYNDHLFDMIVLKGATISDKVGTRTNSTANITLGDDTVVMRNPFDLTYSNGSDYTITGFVWRYKDTLQFMPTAIEGGQVLQTVEEPVIKPSTRELKPDTEVSIECETDGAILYYTI